jgi:hypothetical protein
MINTNPDERYYITLRVFEMDIMTLTSIHIKEGESFNKVAKQERMNVLKYPEGHGMSKGFKPAQIQWAFYTFKDDIFKMFICSDNFNGKTEIKKDW